MRSSLFLTGVLGLALPISVLAQSAQTFSDIPASSTFHSAAEYLYANGIMSGYEEEGGKRTFRPDNKLNRAEAVKLIVTPLMQADELATFTKSVYSDVPAGSWFLSAVEAARSKFGIIDYKESDPRFKPTDPVLKGQFLKMFLLASGVDAKSLYSEIKLPLSIDAQGVSEWYYPFLRYAIASSMTMVTQEGKFSLDRQLTRGDVALLIYRYEMYKEGRRTQALLSEAESEIVNVLQLMEADNIVNAEYAAARSLIAARGALTSKPDEPLVKGAVKTAEGFQTLTRAYRAGKDQKYQEVIQLTGDAWHLAEKAKAFSPSLTSVATQMQAIAKNMADQARELMK